MFDILKTEIYDKWFNDLRDVRLRDIINDRISRVQTGNFGDVSPVGEGVYEIKIHYGAGYRIYYIREGAKIIVLLSGGDKSTQQRDIRKAILLSKEL